MTASPAPGAPGARRLLDGLFGADVATAEGPIPKSAPALRPEEESSIARASADRRREFAAGRALAREALAKLGLSDVALPRTAGRVPDWPEGVVGSISHTRRAGVEYCAVAVGRRLAVGSIGLDVERRDALGPGLRRRVLRPEELVRLERLRPEAAAVHALLAFSAKEAFHKCQFPLTGRSLGFAAASVAIDLPAGTFALTLHEDAGAHLRAGAVLSGRLRVDPQLVATALTLPPADASD